MSKNLILFFFGLSLFSICSCSKPDCTTALPPPDYFLLQIQDTTGNNLIGTTYTDSSYKLTGDNYEAFVSPEPTGPQYMLRIHPMELKNGEDYYLKLSDADSDTLSVVYSVKEDECFTSFILTSVVYNGEDFGADRPVIVEKK
ncbi:MAG: hypothetical protein WDZ35_01210 [Crocinitomicaceae bacterium]